MKKSLSAKRTLTFILSLALAFNSIEMPVFATEMNDEVFSIVNTNDGSDVSSCDISDNDISDNDVSTNEVAAYDVTNGDANERTIVDSGLWKSTFSWVLYSDGKLSFTNYEGSDRGPSMPGWLNYSDQITSVYSNASYVNGYGFRLIPSCANFPNLTSAEIVLNADEYSITGTFDNCTSLEKVTFVGEGNLTLGGSPFINCAPKIDWTGIKNLENDGDFLLGSNYETFDAPFKGLESVTFTDAPRIYNCKNFKTFDMDNLGSVSFDKNGKVLSPHFKGCESLEYVNFGGMDIVEGANLSRLFFDCRNSLTYVNFSGCDFSSVADATDMFVGCEKLETIVTPVGLKWTCALPGTFYDENGNAYTKLPKNEETSVTLTKTKPENTPDVSEGDVSESDAQYAITIAPVETQTFTGKAVTPDVSIYDGEYRLVKNKDYTLSYKNNVNVREKGNEGNEKCEMRNDADAERNGNDEMRNAECEMNAQGGISFEGFGRASENEINAKCEMKNAQDSASSENDEMINEECGTDSANAKMQNAECKMNEDGSATFLISHSTFGHSEGSFSFEHFSLVENSVLANDRSPYGFDETLPSVIVKGKGNYTGTIRMNFDIEAADMNAVTIKNKTALPASAKAQQTLSSAKLGSYALKEGRDFDATVKPVLAFTEKGSLYEEFTSGSAIPENVCGTFLVTLTGRGNFSGNISYEVTAVAKKYDLSKATITLGKNVKNIKWTGTEISIPAGYYDAEKKATYLVEDGEVTDKVVDKNDVYTVKMNGDYLVEGRDFAVVYENNLNLGKAVLTVKSLFTPEGLGGKKSATFQITGTAVKEKDLDFKHFEKTVTYTGEPIWQEVSHLLFLDRNRRSIHYPSDYDVTYKNNVNVGTASVTFEMSGCAGYTGKFTKTFKITPAVLSDENVSVSSTGKYDKKGAVPEITVTACGRELLPGKEYTVSYKNNKKAPGSTATVTIKGKGNFSGQVTKTFTITNGDFSDATVTVAPLEQNKKKGDAYAYKNKVTVKIGSTTLKEKADYVLTYENNTNAALKEGKTAKVTVTPTGNYEGEPVTCDLPIYTGKLTTKNTFVYVGNEGRTFLDKETQLTPKVVVYYGTDSKLAIAKKTGVYTMLDRLEEGVDYRVTYGSNNVVGKNKGTVTVEGIGSFGGKVSAKFTISPKGFDYKRDADGDGTNDDSNPADESEEDRNDPGYVAYNEIICDYYYADPNDGWRLHYRGTIADWHPATDVVVRVHKQFDIVVTKEEMKKNRTVSPMTSNPDADPEYMRVNSIMFGCYYYDKNGNKKLTAMQGDWYPYYGYVTYDRTGKGLIQFPDYLFDK